MLHASCVFFSLVLSHSIFQRTETTAVVHFADRSLDKGFQLLIGLAEIHVPRMWAERHPHDMNKQVREN